MEGLFLRARLNLEKGIQAQSFTQEFPFGPLISPSRSSNVRKNSKDYFE